jgi:hypothetical protein
MQMLLVVSGRDVWVACSACGRPYPPDREPRVGEAQYCDECRQDGIPEKRAKQAERRRIAEARRLHAAGIPPAEIVAKLAASSPRTRVTLAKVRKWTTA